MRSHPKTVWWMFTLYSLTLWTLAVSSAIAFQQNLSTGSTHRTTVVLFAERKPWNIFQFAQQSARFVSPFPSGNVEKRIVNPGDEIWKAGDARVNDFNFAPLDDVVMGGASSSNFDAATGKWKGQVTDANNGGFIGIRSAPVIDYDMSRCNGIELRLKSRTSPSSSSSESSALRLKVVLRDSTDFNGLGWSSSTDLKSGGKENLVKIPFRKQVPTRFAKTVPDTPGFSSNQVRGIQLVYSKFEYDGALNPKFSLGDFEVQVSSIRAY